MSLRVDTSSTKTPARKMLLSPIDLTPPSSTKKRALGELSINLPPRPHSAQDFTTPEHPNQNKKFRKVSEPLTAPLSAGPFSSASRREANAEEAVWGDEVEQAFMEALCRIPKLGRRKVLVNSKPFGRNELIAEYIFRRTGKVRSRKQVSSHIQVLKHLRRGDAQFMALVADSAKDEEESDEPVDIEALLAVSPSLAIPTPFSAQPASSARLDQTSPLCLVARSRTPALSQDNLNNIRVEDFSIWATCQQPDSMQDITSAVYTKLQQASRISTTSPLEDLFNWPSRYPTLSQILADPSSARYPIFRMRAGLLLPKSLNLDGEAQVILRTHLALGVQLSDPREEWACTTRVYTMGKMVLELKQRITMEVTELSDNSGLMKRQVQAKASIPFATDFWAAFLAGLSSNSNSKETDDEDEHGRKSERDAEIAIAGVTMTQQISTLETALESARPVAVLLWEFDLSTGKRPGETTATRIVVPNRTAAAAVAMRPVAMARSASLSQTMQRVKPVRPRLPVAGAHLQRSFSMAAVPSQSTVQRKTEFIAYHGPADASRPKIVQHTTPVSRQAQSQAQTQTQAQRQTLRQPSQAYHQSFRAQPPAPLHMSQAIPSPAHHSASHAGYFHGQYDGMPIGSPANLTYNPMSQYAATQPPMHLVAVAPGAVINGGAPPMSRSFSAPTWQASPAADSSASSWEGSFIDWTLPESAGYLHTDFQIAGDDCFGTAAGEMVMPVEQLCPPSSAAPDAFMVKAPLRRTASAAPALAPFALPDVDADLDDGMPRLGFFPLQG